LSIEPNAVTIVPISVSAKTFVRVATSEVIMAKLRRIWDGLSLFRQFALTACIAVGAGMVVLGSVVSAKIGDRVIHDAAAATVFYLNGLDRSYLQELTSKSALSEESLRALDNAFSESELVRQIASVTICLPDGRIVYSTTRDFIGKTAFVTPKLLKALKGEVVAEFGKLSDEGDALERSLNVPLLDIYVPVRDKGGDDVIAVAELFAYASGLKGELDVVRRESWVAVGGVALLQIILLHTIVWRGNKTIESQRAALADAGRVSVEMSERFLHRLGADLHDGPAQLIGLALLRLDALHPLLAVKHSNSEELEKIRTVLHDCLREVRHLSAGLAPPDLGGLPLRKVVELAVRQHEQRTGSTVSSAIGMLPANTSSLHQVCIYRFVQEGLNNAYRHAAAVGQAVQAVSDGRELTVEVADKGPGFSPSNSFAGGGLGLAGLRARIESLGGKFLVETQLGCGTRLRASFQLAEVGAKDG
jgi:signal transduction histidine kinase